MSSWGGKGVFNSGEAAVFEDGSAGRFGVVWNHAVFLGLFVDFVSGFTRSGEQFRGPEIANDNAGSGQMILCRALPCS